MATSVENCLNILRQDLLQESIPTDQPIPEPESQPLWLGGRVVKKVKNFGLKLADILRDQGWLSYRRINEREIQECRWARSVAGAGLVDQSFIPANVPEQELIERTALARELWQKDPYSFAQWCIEKDQPFPDHFLVAELVPWQMEQFARLGLNRNDAARLSLRLSVAVKLLNPSDTRGQNQNFLPILSTDTPDEAQGKEQYNEILLNLDHSQESADMYLDSFIGNFTPSEQIQLLKACRDELAINPESHQLSEQNLLKKVISDQQKQENEAFFSQRQGRNPLPLDTETLTEVPRTEASWQGNDDYLIDFETPLDRNGKPIK
ncbi:hypothetical protein [Endozoicomonas numazuensis]|uniref:Uncharacterized protein n=1 Tax=Endozoicomonas numazuensis TaxID=1137799 RepID=A0A081NHL2_9GAMM|nr:hypothetical protein [Endozoicomonas numazuensis]KEQ17935.1 hypothetical protein GZ78_09945 [Endozoicomonas numazuensis]